MAVSFLKEHYLIRQLHYGYHLNRIIKKYYTPFFIGNETVSIAANLEDFPYAVYIKGSGTENASIILKKKTCKYWIERDRVLEKYFSPEMQNDSIIDKKAERKNLLKQMSQIDKTIDSISMYFIKNHVNSYAGLRELFYHRRLFSKDSVKILYRKAGSPYTEGSFGQMLATYIKVGNTLKKGDPYFDFTALDIQGITRKLSDYKNKYILLDFSSTDCGPCIESVNELKTLQATFADSLQIITLSADKSKEIWQKGFLRDQPTWPCLWDGKGPAGEAILKYGANGWPTFILINPAGIISAITSGYGKGSLETFLAKYLKKREAGL
jgi:thiol-disulfide isomerase/thioredoxin